MEAGSCSGWMVVVVVLVGGGFPVRNQQPSSVDVSMQAMCAGQAFLWPLTHVGLSLLGFGFDVLR